MFKSERVTEADKEKARVELHEEPSHVMSHIVSLRRWVDSMEFLNCPTDDEFLLMFLRVAKFDHFAAQKRLDNFCTIRSSVRGVPELFEYPSVQDPNMKKFLENITQVPIGRTANGELVILFRMGYWNPDEVPVKKFMQMIYMGMDHAQAYARSQINGIHYFVDYKHCGKKMFESLGDPKLMKHFIRIWQEGNPQRIKGFIIVNEPMLFDTFFRVINFFTHQKIRSRIFRVKNDISKVFDRIPGLKAIMPPEYGGDGRPLVDINNDWIKEFTEYFANGSPWKGIKVDESKRPKDTLANLVEYADYVETGTQGTYTKFEDVY